MNYFSSAPYLSQWTAGRRPIADRHARATPTAARSRPSLARSACRCRHKNSRSGAEQPAPLRLSELRAMSSRAAIKTRQGLRAVLYRRIFDPGANRPRLLDASCIARSARWADCVTIQSTTRRPSDSVEDRAHHPATGRWGQIVHPANPLPVGWSRGPIEMGFAFKK